MILEVAILNVIPGREAEFEDAFRQAISTIPFLPSNITLPCPACRTDASKGNTARRRNADN
jgi:hypothetical protein